MTDTALNRIETALGDLGLTQVDIAQQLKLSQSGVSRQLASACAPTERMKKRLRRLCREVFMPRAMQLGLDIWRYDEHALFGLPEIVNRDLVLREVSECKPECAA
jgi:hypothetical protein